MLSRREEKRVNDRKSPESSQTPASTSARSRRQLGAGTSAPLHLCTSAPLVAAAEPATSLPWFLKPSRRPTDARRMEERWAGRA
ncbi:hypothetical protein BDV96DRAFT_575677, partial [Lophiotrema nucula]